MAGRKKSKMPISSALGSSALLPAGLGFRNLLINGDFRINQRGYASASNLSSGAYGFDRWKSTFTNTTLTFTSAPQGQIVTINSGGSIEQVIEQQNITAGTFVLSWTGTATGRVYNTGATPPAYAASPIIVTLDGLANVEVEFTASGATKTLWKPQLELNYQVTPFEQRPIGIELMLCQRYYLQSENLSNYNNNGLIIHQRSTSNSTTYWAQLPTLVQMRASPSISLYSYTGVVNNVSNGDSGAPNSAFSISVITGNFFSGNVTSGTSTSTLYANFVASAEL
jgi:hypothetical protein